MTREERLERAALAALPWALDYCGRFGGMYAHGSRAAQVAYEAAEAFVSEAERRTGNQPAENLYATETVMEKRLRLGAVK